MKRDRVVFAGLASVLVLMDIAGIAGWIGDDVVGFVAIGAAALLAVYGFSTS